ncbi:anthranilate synthase component II [Virgibacillus ainsalahensis]
MILLLDNYDSFTYNLYQYFSEEAIDVQVARNDKITIKEIENLQPEGLVISPGPGLPEETGICIEAVKHFHNKLPIFGVCLGQQIIAEAFGGQLKPATFIKHGKTSLVSHNGSGLFQNLPSPVEVMRYHSYVVDGNTLPSQLEVVSSSLEDDEIMAINHRDYPVYGVQFHPESIGTNEGKEFIKNFLHEIRKESPKNETIFK